jgi:hypothetical protein
MTDNGVLLKLNPTDIITVKEKNRKQLLLCSGNGSTENKYHATDNK